MHDRTFKVRDRDWRKFLNKQKYAECQLVTAVNARYWLTGRIIGQDTKRYEKLVDRVGARHGSAIRIEKAWKTFGIEVAKEYKWVFDIRPSMLPMELNVWHKSYGFHSVLVIDCEIKSEAIRVANFSKATSMYGWIFREDLQHFIVDDPGKRGWRARKFRVSRPLL